MARLSSRLLGAASVACAVVAPVAAQEQIDYAYDARGRLVAVTRSGAVNDGVQAGYAYDEAGNRTSVTSLGPTPPSLSIGDALSAEGQPLAFTVSRAGPLGSAVSVNYATANGTAISVSDYVAKSGVLSFAAGEASKPISITTVNDAVYEPLEQMYVNLSGATGGVAIADPQGKGSITDNDPPPGPSFSVGDVLADVGENVVFTVTKTGSTTGSFSVSYATANWTAIAGTHYTAKSGVLTFSPTTNSLTVSVPTIYQVYNGKKRFYLNLTNPSGNATISDPQAIGSIQGDGDTNPCPLCRTSEPGDGNE